MIYTPCKNVVVNLLGVLGRYENEFAYRAKSDLRLEVDPDSLFAIRNGENAEQFPGGWVEGLFLDPTFYLNTTPNVEVWFWINHYFSEGIDIIITGVWDKSMTPVITRWLDEWQISYNFVIPSGSEELADVWKAKAIYITDSLEDAKSASRNGKVFILDDDKNRGEVEGVTRVNNIWHIKLKKI